MGVILKERLSGGFWRHSPIKNRCFLRWEDVLFSGETGAMKRKALHGLFDDIVEARQPSASGDSWMYPDPNVPLWEIPKNALYSGYGL